MGTANQYMVDLCIYMYLYMYVYGIFLEILKKEDNVPCAWFSKLEITLLPIPVEHVLGTLKHLQ